MFDFEPDPEIDPDPILPKKSDPDIVFWDPTNCLDSNPRYDTCGVPACEGDELRCRALLIGSSPAESPVLARLFQLLLYLQRTYVLE